MCTGEKKSLTSDSEAYELIQFNSFLGSFCTTMKFSEDAAATDKIISLKHADKVWTTVLNTLTTIPSK